ncbi:uncharacterized protein FIBRA_02414 [Fibroporia radiculosa]|uniref:Programmed cell death protein 2 C-terminal domain-containing protein n=1 Tax=Fibroporia radiculosa TaxID=599839 RepID=J4H1U5_9APHY|nr:uncharacterized protein FIBRA_02414 [Fibroporia radiculosa]CCM00384.1 predicted protein [Fibroporia radiculosa]
MTTTKIYTIHAFLIPYFTSGVHGMAPINDDDWSDSDDDVGSDVETAVQLGLPDGPVDSAADLRDVRVSRLGGHPTFLNASEPSFEFALCKVCDQPMQLLAQVWCPLENSPNDRVLYMWGCAKGCTLSVRAWRSMRYNKKYAEKLANKVARQKAKEEEKRKAAPQNVPKVNPFSMKSANTTNPFSLGSQVFGSPLPSKVPTELELADDPPSDESESEVSDEDGTGNEVDHVELAAHMSNTVLDDSVWSAAPAYRPLYLSTVSEYLPPARKTKVPAAADIDDDDDGKKDKGGSWTVEGYENSMEVDHVFERFTRRVGYEGEQCLRYELGGTPLPFASDQVFDKLFPAPLASPLPVTKAVFTVVPAQKRTYDATAVPSCPHCKSRRVFECQLMPNLINLLNAPVEGGSAKLSDEERRQEVLQALKGSRAADRMGMEWGTCMVFSCENDCSDDSARSCWREEVVLVQWDD